MQIATVFVTCNFAFAGEVVVYPGKALQTIGGVSNSLAPTALEGNTVTVDATPEIGGNIWGGFNNAGLDVQNNTVILKSGSVGKSIFGGQSTNGRVSGNTLEIKGGTVGEGVIGGFSQNSDVSGNTVRVSGGTVTSIVYGGRNATGGKVMENLVVIGGTARLNSDVNGGHGANEEIAGNRVLMTGGTVGANIYGGHGTSNGQANSNVVRVAGGQVNGKIYGGFSSDGSASGNRVEIAGGLVKGHVYGASAIAAGMDSINNTVVLSGAPVFFDGTAHTGIYGSEFSALAGDRISGNTLEVHTGGLKALTVENFASYTFAPPASTPLDRPLLHLTKADGSNISGTSLTAKLNGSALYRAGGKVDIIRNENGLNADNITTSIDRSSTMYVMGLSRSPVAISATATPAPGLAVLHAVPLAGKSLLELGAEHLVGNAMEQARLATGMNSGGNVTGFTPFATVGGGKMELRHGPKVNGMVFDAGLATSFAVDSGKVLVAPFVEGGFGNYKDKVTPGNDVAMEMKGRTSFVGGGLMLRYNAHPDIGFYAEASARVGKLSGHARSDQLHNEKDRANFRTSSTYYGGHGGLGWIIPLRENVTLDAYAKYFFIKSGGGTVRVLEDMVRFGTTASHTFRGGARLELALGSAFNLYGGGWFEQERGDKSRIWLHGRPLPGVKTGGASGAAEAGARFGSLSGGGLDLGIQAMGGAKRGYSGTARLSWNF